MTVTDEAVVHLATSADRALVRSLLAEARLPVDDLDLMPELMFWVVRGDDAGVIGAIGLERYGDVGLLRSLVVTPGRRRHGLGEALVRTLEEHANAMEIAQLVLLTETAEAFFRRLGYAVIDRENAPSAVAASAEFRTLCPSTAVCMTKRLR
jgi:N-acetylglutamate synthase-like GNAT family acetyltransferase